MKPVHFSQLKRINQSAAHCKHALDAPESDPTASLLLGSALHSMTLGGKPVVECTLRRDARTAAYQDFLAANPDSYILTPREYALCAGMSASLLASELAMAALKGRHEIPLSWEWMGRACATRGVDVDTGECLTELKTTKFSEPSWFSGECVRRGYVEQLVWYANAVSGHRDLKIVAVESSAPHPVTVFYVTPQMRDQAERRLRLWMERFLVCEQSGEWPGYVQYEVPLEPRDVELDLEGLEEEEVAA